MMFATPAFLERLQMGDGASAEPNAAGVRRMSVVLSLGNVIAKNQSTSL